uniref:Carboxypeptidase B n=2 Tax=Lygus hesperus TaxID=30085 RepID=A0A0A9YSJ1_LYGHE
MCRAMKIAALILLSLAQLSIQSSKLRRDTLFGLPLDQPYFSRQQASQYPASARDVYPQNYGSAPGYVQFPGYASGFGYPTGYAPPPVGNYDYAQREGPKPAGDVSPITFQRYSTVDQIDAYLDYLKGRYPELVDVQTIGQSVEGRKIRVVKIQPRIAVKGPRPKILVDAGIHAREWIAPAVALYMINQLVENNHLYKNLTENLEWHIIPLLNPDGYAYSMTEDRMWRKNRANTSNPQCPGVDLNRNFDIFFGGQGTSQDPCDETYTGAGPFSEPEARALRDYAMSLNHIRLYLTLHSYGQYFLYPWGFGDSLPRDWKDLDKLGRIAQHAVQKVRGTKYRVGSSTRLLGAAAGGSDDWMKGRAGVKYSYTVELPGGGERGFDLPSSRILGVSQETWEGLRTMANYIGHERRRRNK